MKKSLYILYMIFANINTSASVINVGDTTLTSNWNAGGNILNITGKISGNYQISNAIIQANPFTQIFDTTVTLSNIQCERFSAMWYGAKPSNDDNSAQLQMAIKACINKSYSLFIHGGIYQTNRTLWAATYDSINGNYLQTQVKIYGTASFWGDAGTQIKYSGNGNCINFQLNKGSVLSGVMLVGGWVSPTGTLSYYYSLPDSLYVNQAATGNGTGLAIDPIDAPGTSGSTGCFFHDLQIRGFNTLIKISNNGTQNGEIMLFDRIQFGQAQYGVRTYQPQEKANEFRHIYSWSAINWLFSISRGNYIIDGLNVAGRCRNLFSIYAGGYFPSYVSNVYAESFGSIGNVIGGWPISFNNCVFDFAYQSDVGKKILLTSNSNNTRFNDCSFRYYGNNTDTLKFSGPSTFDNCAFTGPVIGATGSVFRNTNSGTETIIGNKLIVTDTIFKWRTPNSVKITLRKSYKSQ